MCDWKQVAAIQLSTQAATLGVHATPGLENRDLGTDLLAVQSIREGKSSVYAASPSEHAAWRRKNKSRNACVAKWCAHEAKPSVHAAQVGHMKLGLEKNR